ncbi:MAG: S9 family peptidase [Candidatus Eisenbacteria bacterium]|nr:S9 family peptidase [Candidatus Eisenbacteria bacterium]
MSAGAAPRTLAVDDLFRIAEVQDARLSPEGKWLAYVVSTTDLKQEKTRRQIWMTQVQGGEAVPLTAKDESSWSPRWSPDGRSLAFLSARGGQGKAKTQVWTLSRDGGEALQLTETAQDVESFEWSPAGGRLVLVLQDPSPEERDAAAEQEKGIRKTTPKTARPWVMDRLQFKRDYVGYLDRRRTHLYVLDVSTRRLAQVTSGDYDDSEPAWSPDERYLAFTSNRTPEPDANDNSDIWVVAADNPDTGKTVLRLTSNPGEDSQPAWSPDGKRVACVSRLEPRLFYYATGHLAVVPAAGGEAKVLTGALDRNVTAPLFTPDGQSICFALEDDGADVLGSIPVDCGPVSRPIAGRISLQSFSMGQDGAVAAVIADPQRPAEAFLYRAPHLKRISTVNDTLMAQLRLGDVEYVRFKSRDGTALGGYVVKPPGWSAAMRYPALLRIHGGPVSQYTAEFHFEAQLFAAQGYVVMLPNPRGSSGYGEKLSAAIFADWGNKDYEDVMAMVDHAVARGLADPARLGVGGWSYGGILTDHVITRTTRFKAAITGASDVLNTANYGHDEYQREWEQELGLPWRNRALWDRLSPFYQVEKIVTPTLILCGEEDWNCPVINSEQLYQSLRRLGRTTELVVYPGQHHGIEKPSYKKDRLERYLAWYARYVRGEGAPPPTGSSAPK